ncbi:uncharacterized protein [Nicotiana sylvestris]|uniref:uncharacterized protein n=1 Tax=Nicotiana sylvestris TaxID=4096 RepID=UPI00388C8617
MAKETGSEISFQDAANVARRVKMVLAQESGQGSNKRSHHSGIFSGASSGGKDYFGRGNPPKPFQSTLQAFHGVPGGRVLICSRQGQQSQQPKSCYTCGDTRHIARFCPRALSSSQHQCSHAMVLAPGVPPPSQIAKGRGRGVRGGGQVVRGGGQAARGGSQLVGGRPRDVVQSGTVSICSREASVLYDPGSIYSYVSSYFAPYLVMPRDSLSASVYVSTPVGDSIMVDRVYHTCVVVIGGLETHVDLLLLDMVDFDVILGMDWLSPYHAILDCHAKTVTLALLGLPNLEWRGFLVILLAGLSHV